MHGNKLQYDFYDFYLVRRIVEAYLLRRNINLQSIKSMSEEEIMEYYGVISAMDEVEMEKVNV